MAEDKAILVTKLTGDYYDCIWTEVPSKDIDFDVDESDYDEWWEEENAEHRYE